MSQSQIISEDFSDVTPENQYPQKQNLFTLQQLKRNWKCAILTILVASSLASTVACNNHISSREAFRGRRPDGCTENSRWMLILCTIILYSFYLMECSYALDYLQLCNARTKTTRAIYDQIERMRSADPIIWWKGTCYHYIRRKRRMTEYRRGMYVVSSKIFKERVNSFSSSAIFNFANCGMKDISNNLVLNAPGRAVVIKYKFSKGFAFANMTSAIEFEEQRSSFFQELRQCDDFMDMSEGMDLKNCSVKGEEQIALFSENGTIPWYTRYSYYWLFSICLLSLPFRLISHCNTFFLHYKVTKLFGITYANNSVSSERLALYHLNGSFSEDNDTVTPTSFGGSTQDLLRQSRLIPSYSEALLIGSEAETSLFASAGSTNANQEEESPVVIREGNGDGDVVIYNENAENDENNDNEDDDFEPFKSPSKQPMLPHSSCASKRGRPHRRFFYGANSPGYSGSQLQRAPVDNDKEVADGGSGTLPPTYEEALMLPVVEDSQHGINSAYLQSYTPSHAENIENFQMDSRVQTNRTFLSIETSL